MLASMPRLYGGDEARMVGDARRVARTPANIEVAIVSAQGDETPVVVGDISIFGCSIGRGADELRLGAFVWLSAGGEPAVTGIVRWVRDGVAGIEFVKPLAPGGRGLARLIHDD